MAAEEMEAAARLSQHVAEPGPKPHVVRRALGSAPDGLVPMATVRVAGVSGVIRLPARQITRTGVALEVPADSALEVSQGVAVIVDLDLGKDPNGQAIRARLPATVAHLRRPAGGQPGGLSLRWETRGARAEDALQLLLDRLGNPAT